jgi:hypothetical protein
LVTNAAPERAARKMKRGTTWRTVLEWAADLPGVEEGLCYGTPALYVRKRILARLREDGETVAIKVDFLDRDVLLEADPVAFFLTDHYRPYPMVVMRLAKARPAVARQLLEEAWRRAAPKSLVATRASGQSRKHGRASASRRETERGSSRRRSPGR